MTTGNLEGSNHRFFSCTSREIAFFAVHELQPADIEVVAAIGDSITVSKWTFPCFVRRKKHTNKKRKTIDMFLFSILGWIGDWLNFYHRFIYADSWQFLEVSSMLFHFWQKHWTRWTRIPNCITGGEGGPTNCFAAFEKYFWSFSGFRLDVCCIYLPLTCHSSIGSQDVTHLGKCHSKLWLVILLHRFQPPL